LRIAFIIFDRMTALDFIGVYDPVTRLKSMRFNLDLVWEICSFSKEVRDDRGLLFTPTRVGESLQNYDLVIVPGGFGARSLVDDRSFIQWLRTSAAAKLKASVCTGSLLLGAAGFLEGKQATTHRSAFSELGRFCSNVIDRRIVDEDEVITAGGVSSAIDLGLYLVEKFAGFEVKEKISRQMEYPCNSIDSKYTAP
jgi:transcriptional regulator GlxA family with amidase domain